MKLDKVSNQNLPMFCQQRMIFMIKVMLPMIQTSNFSNNNNNNSTHINKNRCSIKQSQMKTVEMNAINLEKIKRLNLVIQIKMRHPISNKRVKIVRQ